MDLIYVFSDSYLLSIFSLRHARNKLNRLNSIVFETSSAPFIVYKDRNRNVYFLEPIGLKGWHVFEIKEVIFEISSVIISQYNLSFCLFLFSETKSLTVLWVLPFKSRKNIFLERDFTSCKYVTEVKKFFKCYLIKRDYNQINHV